MTMFKGLRLQRYLAIFCTSCGLLLCTYFLFPTRLAWTKVEPPLTSVRDDPLPICTGILAFEGVRTLQQTLLSYRDELFPRVREKKIFFQELNTDSRVSWARSVTTNFPGLDLMYDEFNVGQRGGFLKLVKSCEQPFVLILEEDFRIAVGAKVQEQLSLAMELLEGDIDAVRLRSRLLGGEPNYAKIAWENSGSRLGAGVMETHLLEHVMWDSDAEWHVPQLRVCRLKPKTWCASSRNACYTNNPVLYKTSFLKHLVLEVPDDPGIHFEPWLTEYWMGQNFTVAYSDGIFTHDRLDRDRVV